MRTMTACLLLLLGTLLPAQVVHVANFAPLPFHGWHRATIDVLPKVKAGTSKADDGTPVRWVLGRTVGRDARVVDLLLDLPAGSTRTIDLANAEPLDFARGRLPLADLLGTAAIGGAPLQVVSVQEDGAGWLAHLQGRVGPMLHLDLWGVWYPDMPGVVAGEAVLTASNPAVPDVIAVAPANLTLTWGSAYVSVLGGSATLMAEGDTIADGQARSWPVTLVWPALLDKAAWRSVGAVLDRAIAANGIAKLYPEGSPSYVGDALAWSRQHRAAAIRRLGTWEDGPLGVAAYSGRTGAQDDQVWPLGVAMAGVPSLGCEQVGYFVALGQSRRPCHHLERNGDLLRLAEHPQLVAWDGRAHWHRGVSPDQLGKARSLTTNDTNGWFGPDVEHDFFGYLYVAHRIYGSPALQWQLQAQARVYLLQWTVRDGLSTSQPYAARAWGWEGILAVRLYEALDDRVLAEQVKARWQARWDTILRPAAAGEVWDIRIDDPRLGAGPWWIPWQQAVGAYGLELAGRWFDRPAAREAALRGARAVVARAWRQENGRWLCCEQQAVDGRGVFGGSFRLFGMCIAPQIVLMHEPGHAKARAILDSLLADTNGGAHPWLVPGVR